MRRLAIISAVSAAMVCGGIARAQLSTEEAMKRLKEKQEARQAERDKLVTIKQGDLEDLKAEIASLKAQLANLQGQAANAASAAKKVEPVRALAIGETRDQVFDFLRRHPQDYEVTADTMSTPNVTSQTIVKQVDRQGQNAIDNKNALNVAANQSEQTKTQQQVVTEREKTEKLVITRKEYVPVEVGTHSEFNGIRTTIVHDTQKMWVPTEKILVEIVEGTVTTVDHEGLNASIEQAKMRSSVRRR